MASCERCWRRAQMDAFSDPSVDQVDRYHELLKQTPCSPEDQAGGADATPCGKCGRKTVHVYARVCMACGDAQ